MKVNAVCEGFGSRDGVASPGSEPGLLGVPCVVSEHPELAARVE